MILTKFLQECYLPSPSAPRNVNASNITWNRNQGWTATISWKPPEKNIVAVSSYMLLVLNAKNNKIIRRQQIVNIVSLQYILTNLPDNTDLLVIMIAESSIAQGTSSNRLSFKIPIHVVPPQPKCGFLPQATWMSTEQSSNILPILWNDGFSLGHVPLSVQSVHLDLIGNNRHVLIENVSNVTVGSLEMFGPGSHGTNHRLIVAEQSLLILSKWLQVGLYFIPSIFFENRISNFFIFYQITHFFSMFYLFFIPFIMTTNSRIVICLHLLYQEI